MLKHIPFYASLLEERLRTKVSDLPEDWDIRIPTQSHVLVYGAIEAHAMGDKGCIASNKTIASEVGLSAGRVANIISELNGAGWIYVQLNGLNQRMSITPLLTLHAGVNPPSQEREPPLHAGVNIEHSKENTVRDIKNKQKDLVKPESPEIAELVIEWEKVYGYKPKALAAEKAFIKKLIKAHGKERVSGSIPAAHHVVEIEYAPVITSFKDLWYKWEKLEGFYRRKQGQQDNRVATIVG